MKASKWVSSALALTLAGSMAAGCSGSKTGDSPKPGAEGGNASNAKQEIKINLAAEPPALDSSKSTANAAFTMLNALNEGLYRIDKDGKVQPGLAKAAPEVSTDGLTYKITLRDNLVWADGTPLKANDFVSAFKRTLDPATKAQYSFMLAWIQGGAELNKAKPEEVQAKKDAVGVKALDDKTLEIKLSKPVGFFTSLLAFPIFFPQKRGHGQSSRREVRIGR